METPATFLKFVIMQRIWIYQANRELSESEEARILTKLETFTAQWKAHGTPLSAKAEVRHQRFVILMVDDDVAPPSGCSIDKSVHLLKEVEAETGVNLFDRMQVAFRDGEQIRAVSRAEFEQLLAQNKINGDTIVFNNLIDTYPQLTTHWEVPLRESWHGQVFL